MLVLFDVDGTLIKTEGAGVKAIMEAGRRLLGPHFSLDGVEIAGRLDPLIWADAAVANGVKETDVRLDEFRALYGTCLRERFAAHPTSRPLPGVQALIERLRTLEPVTLGLLTGNYPETGRLKLEVAGLDPDHFAVAAWGSDAATRRDLPAVARQRYHARRGRSLEPDEVVIVGDTPHDVDCARASGCRVIAVATGPTHSRADLVACHPDLLLDDLTETERIVDWILTAAAGKVRS